MDSKGTICFAMGKMIFYNSSIPPQAWCIVWTFQAVWLHRVFFIIILQNGVFFQTVLRPILVTFTNKYQPCYVYHLKGRNIFLPTPFLLHFFSKYTTSIFFLYVSCLIVSLCSEQSFQKKKCFKSTCPISERNVFWFSFFKEEGGWGSGERRAKSPIARWKTSSQTKIGTSEVNLWIPITPPTGYGEKGLGREWMIERKPLLKRITVWNCCKRGNLAIISGLKDTTWPVWTSWK